MTVSGFFLPNRQIVAGISNSNPCIVSTTEDHGYHDGLFIRFFFPANFGINILSNRQFEITVLSSTTFSIPIDTTFSDLFVVSEVQSPQIIPIGENALTLVNLVFNSGTIAAET